MTSHQLDYCDVCLLLRIVLVPERGSYYVWSRSTKSHRGIDSNRNPSSSSILKSGKNNTDGVSSSSNSLIYSAESLKNKVLWPSDKQRIHHSDTAVVNTPFGKMPQWMTMQGMEYQRRARSIPDFLSGADYGYQHQVYVSAAEIFERLAVRKVSGECLVQYTPLELLPGPPLFETKKIKRQAYELAYETLKYQELLEEILIDSGHFFAHPTADDTTALVVVMLYDFLKRKWAPRCRIVGERLIKDVTDVEDGIMDNRIRLAAALARCRVKNQSLSIDYILPEVVRQQEKCASSLPQYSWVNTAKTSVDQVLKSLQDNHYVEVTDELPPRGKFYKVDTHCEDVLSFPRDQKEVLKHLDIHSKGMIVLQDKTSSLAARSVAAMLTEDDECDLIHTDVLAGLTTAHLAVYLHNVTKKRMEAKELMYGSHITRFRASVSSNETESEESSDEGMRRPTVFAFGVRSESHREQLNHLLKQLGLKNVKLLSEKFENVDTKRDPRFGAVKIILVTPQCTRTAVANPIDFMLNEGDSENYAVLRDLSHGERHNNATESARSHVESLKVALKVPSVQAVVYTTRSVHPAENEQAVNSAIKWQRETGEGSKPFRLCPPTLPLTSNDIKEGEKEVTVVRGYKSQSLKHNFLRMKQSPDMNGCFIAVLTRQIDTTDSATVKDILKRAALQGLIMPVSTKKEPDEKTPQQVVETVVEPRPVEKVQRRKSKVAFGKKTKPSSGTNVSRSRKSVPKVVESVDVEQMLENYKKEAALKAIKSGEVNQVNINIEFHNETSLRFSEASISGNFPDQSLSNKSSAVNTQMNTDVERMLQELSSPKGGRT
uniref:Putative methyltransferase NSUN7 n=1 Tax=Phallusia mammillata TaxID=59560 RepID=A0A6F9DN48_9ASCI|nr:putative methyltransferase NSUN7 [Phallusia mammillata]